MSSKRIYIQGLPPETSASDLSTLFQTFGLVQSLFIARDSFQEKYCRGFGYLSLEIEDKSWRKCLAVLNGTLWKGNRLHIEEARKADIMERYKAEECHVAQRCRPIVRHCSNMDRIRLKDLYGRKGWYGLPVPIMRIRKPSGKLITVVPGDVKDELIRFHYGNRQKPLINLSWFPPSPEAVSLPVLSNCTEIEPLYEDPKGGGHGFSLSKSLHLPTILLEPTSVSSTPLTCEAQHPPMINWGDLFLEIRGYSSSHEWPISTTSASMWKDSRSELRKDFRKQIKESRKNRT